MILIAGGGIAGLVMGLTLHQLGLPFQVFERVAEPRPLGVGINLQPNSIRELFDLGLEAELEAIGVRPAGFGSNRGACTRAITGRNIPSIAGSFR